MIQNSVFRWLSNNLTTPLCWSFSSTLYKRLSLHSKWLEVMNLRCFRVAASNSSEASALSEIHPRQTLSECCRHCFLPTNTASREGLFFKKMNPITLGPSLRYSWLITYFLHRDYGFCSEFDSKGESFDFWKRLLTKLRSTRNLLHGSWEDNQ